MENKLDTLTGTLIGEDYLTTTEMMSLITEAADINTKCMELYNNSINCSG